MLAELPVITEGGVVPDQLERPRQAHSVERVALTMMGDRGGGYEGR